MKSDNGPGWIRNKIDEIASVLLHKLKPVLNRFVDNRQSYTDFMELIENAWELCSKILTSRLTFDFKFPDIGSRYSSQSMIPIWPDLDPLELQSKHWRIALAATPVITCRNDTGTNISAHSVTLSDVMCMQ
jgi:hypothetical protein